MLRTDGVEYGKSMYLVAPWRRTVNLCFGSNAKVSRWEEDSSGRTPQVYRREIYRINPAQLPMHNISLPIHYPTAPKQVR
jgi:hypothetical protein